MRDRQRCLSINIVDVQIAITPADVVRAIFLIALFIALVNGDTYRLYEWAIWMQFSFYYEGYCLFRQPILNFKGFKIGDTYRHWVFTSL